MNSKRSGGGREKCNDRQAVYDAWVQNSIPSTDARNGHNKVTKKKEVIYHFVT